MKGECYCRKKVALFEFTQNYKNFLSFSFSLSLSLHIRGIFLLFLTIIFKAGAWSFSPPFLWPKGIFLFLLIHPLMMHYRHKYGLVHSRKEGHCVASCRQTLLRDMWWCTVLHWRYTEGQVCVCCMYVFVCMCVHLCVCVCVCCVV